MNQAALEAITFARSQLLLDHPFFGVLALRLELIERSDIATLGTDGRHMVYNPEFFLALPDALKISAVAHEVMHCVMQHNMRRGLRDPRKWNVACDFTINPILKEAGMQLGSTWLHDEKYIGKSADEIYAMLPDSSVFEAQDEVMDAGGGAEEADSVLAAEWKVATLQAAKIAQAKIGTIHGTLAKFLEGALAPVVPWKDVLASFMTERVKDDYSWRRPNPYFIQQGIFMPTMDGVGMGALVIVVDSSGSTWSVIDEFGAAVRDVVNSVRPERVHVIYADMEVNRVDVFQRGDEISLKMVGGGGTDFRPAFDYIEKHSIQPACMLYLTDMYGAFPANAPDYPVLWCTTTPIQGPFGSSIQIKE